MAVIVMYLNMLSLFVTLILIGEVRSIDIDQVNRDLQTGGRHLCKYCWACVYAEYCDWACFFRVSEYCDFCVYNFHCYTTCPYCVAMPEAVSESSTVTTTASYEADETSGLIIKLSTPLSGTKTEKPSIPTRETFKHENTSEKKFSTNMDTKKQSEDGENITGGTVGKYTGSANGAGSKGTVVDNSENSNNGGLKEAIFESSGDDDGNPLRAIHSTEADDISSSGDGQEILKT